MKKICVVTATRAEYGLLKPIIDKINRDSELELSLVVTGMHLSPEFGFTYKEIEEDGYCINHKVNMPLDSDTPDGLLQSMGTVIVGISEVFNEEHPDMVILLGDRFETLIVAVAAQIHRIPVAHIHGGETTEGAIDEAFRHAITKMSQVHFTATEEYRNRVIQLGEYPGRVFSVGALGVENIKSIKKMTKEELETSIQFKFDRPTVMVTYHPVTLEKSTSGQQFQHLLNVLESIPEINIIFTKANADTDGKIINHMIDEFAQRHKERCIAVASLGQVRYLSALQFCAAVIGNSSSGIIEAPSFGIPTVNIGDRQKGRTCAKSVIHCGTEEHEIRFAVNKALSTSFHEEFCDKKNPYEGENTSEAIINVIKKCLNEGISLKKKFYDIKR